jgi:hypothetical protein
MPQYYCLRLESRLFIVFGSLSEFYFSLSFWPETWFGTIIHLCLSITVLVLSPDFSYFLGLCLNFTSAFLFGLLLVLGVDFIFTFILWCTSWVQSFYILLSPGVLFQIILSIRPGTLSESRIHLCLCTKIFVLSSVCLHFWVFLLNLVYSFCQAWNLMWD